MSENLLTVAIVDGTTTFGGAFEIGVTLGRHLNAIDGVRAHLFTAQPPEVLERRAHEGVPFHSFPVRPWSYKGSGLISHGLHLTRNLGWREFPAARRLASLVKQLDVSVVHLNNALNPQMHGAIGAWMAGVPCVCSYRDYPARSRVVWRLEPLVDRHIPGSRSVTKHIEEVCGVPAQKIVPLGDPIDTDLFHPEIPPTDLEGQFGIPRGRKVFTIFGRLVPWKGHESFLQAARIVLERLPDAHAMLVGDTSDGEPEFGEHLKQLAADLGIADRTTFTGYRTDVSALMCASDLLVHASIDPEPFGTVILEGMACGRPYVAMNEGGPLEMVIPGEQGLLVPPNQPEAMAEAIISILSRPEYAARLGRAARERALSVFSAPIITRQYLDLYREVIEERKRGGKSRTSVGVASREPAAVGPTGAQTR